MMVLAMVLEVDQLSLADFPRVERYLSEVRRRPSYRAISPGPRLPRQTSCERRDASRAGRVRGSASRESSAGSAMCCRGARMIVGALQVGVAMIVMAEMMNDAPQDGR